MIPQPPEPPQKVRFPKITLLKSIAAFWWHIRNPEDKHQVRMKLKQGVTTTEFWVVIAGGVISTSMAALDMVDAKWAVAAVTSLGAIYTLVRGALKNKPQ